jgi:hypothetical protein
LLVLGGFMLWRRISGGWVLDQDDTGALVDAPDPSQLDE